MTFRSFAAAAVVLALAPAGAQARGRAPAPGLTAHAGSRSVLLRVNAPRARHVRIWRTTRRGRWPRRAILAVRGGRRTVVDRHVKLGRRYYYRARAVSGRRASGFSAVRSVRLAVRRARPAPAPPVAPAPAPAPRPTVTPTPAPVARYGSLFADHFDGPDGLITNEFAYWNPQLPQSVIDPVWGMESGSLFRRDGHAWTGVPDDQAPDACSCNHTNSAVFRAWTKRAFGDITLRVTVTVNGYTSTPTTPAVDWDGVHIWVRRVTEFELYYVSVARRDGSAVIKKKVPGGPSNDGTYYTLASRSNAGIGVGRTGQVTATIRDLPDGSVRIDALLDGEPLISATDTGVGGPPITADGGVGVRGDNVDAGFDDVLVDPAS